MKGQEYIVVKINELGLEYDSLYFPYGCYKEAYRQLRKNDLMFVCRPDSVFYADNWQGWRVKGNGDVLRVVTKK